MATVALSQANQTLFNQLSSAERALFTPVPGVSQDLQFGWFREGLLATKSGPRVVTALPASTPAPAVPARTAAVQQAAQSALIVSGSRLNPSNQAILDRLPLAQRSLFKPLDGVSHDYQFGIFLQAIGNSADSVPAQLNSQGALKNSDIQEVKGKVEVLTKIYEKLSAITGCLALFPIIKLILLAVAGAALALTPVGWVLIGLAIAAALISLVALVCRHNLMENAGMQTNTAATFLKSGVGMGVLGPLYLLGEALRVIFVYLPLIPK